MMREPSRTAKKTSVNTQTHSTLTKLLTLNQKQNELDFIKRQLYNHFKHIKYLGRQMHQLMQKLPCSSRF